MNRWTLALVAFSVIALLSMSATGGFTSTAADRSVDVSVVQDEDAYLGLSWSRNDCEPNIQISNRFGEELDYTVNVVRTNLVSVDEIDNQSDDIATGGTEKVEIYLEPKNGSGKRSVTVQIEATSPSTEVTALQRQRTVGECTGNDDNGDD
jgi:hypothetical protein